MGSINRKIPVQDGPGIKEDSVSKICNAKGLMELLEW
jgi:hypothetical protein